tara:strand:+ start:2329 stop:5508 length:3180 start_codon:yes stop_codon:yes gene_type:complete
MNYTPLHVHSDYSLLDGLMSTSKLVDRAVENGMKNLALTDHGTMRGLIDFYYECKKKDINAIMGQEFYFAEDRTTKEEQLNGKPYFHTTILAQNTIGWQNMIALTTKANSTGFYYKPRIDYDLVEQHHEGLLYGSGCFGSIFSTCALQHNYIKMQELLDHFTRIFGDRFYIELTASESSDQKFINYQLLKEAKDRGIRHVIMSDAHWAKDIDYPVHDFLYAMNTGKKYEDPERRKFPTKETWLKSYDEMWDYWSREASEFNIGGKDMSISEEDFAIGLENTNWIAGKCAIDIQEMHKNYLMPEIKTDNPLQDLIYRACNHRKELFMSWDSKTKDKYFERLRSESELIVDQGYFGYFWMTADLCDYMKDNKILKGIARGSAGGSLLAYMLGITELDPLEHNLTFERFMNEHKKSMPDIDIDIDDEKRQDILDYFIERYGIENVAQIGTNITMQTKLASKMVGKTLGIPFEEANSVNDQIEAEDFEDPIVKNLSDKFPDWLPLTKEFKGKPRSIGKHAAGIAIANKPLKDVVPLQRGKNESLITEWTDGSYRKELTEVLKLLKFDLLGISNLAILQGTLDLIRETKPKNHELLRLDLSDQDLLNHISFDDSYVYENIFPDNGDHKTLGIFQFDTGSMSKLLSLICPKNLNELCALNSINRPATKQANVHEHYANARNSGDIFYDHELLEPILKDTYGQIIYQEQVMEIAHKIGGLTLAETDLFRTVLVKITEANKEQQEDDKKRMVDKFIAGSINKGMTEEEAVSLAGKLEEFAGYGFNKSHSRAYSILAYYTMYFKTYFYPQFLISYLNKRPDELEKVIKEFGLENILPVDINKSRESFALEDDKIRLGFKGIKGLGAVAIRELIKHQPFTSLEDLVSKVEKRKVNKTRIAALWKSGSLRPFGKEYKTNFVSEMEVLGIPISSNGNLIIEYCKSNIPIKNSNGQEDVWTDLSELKNMDNGSIVYVCGLVTKASNRNWSSKKNKDWKPKGFTGELQDNTGYCDILSFNFRDERIRPGNILFFEGKKSVYGSKMQVNATKVLNCKENPSILENFDNFIKEDY